MSDIRAKGPKGPLPASGPNPATPKDEVRTSSSLVSSIAALGSLAGGQKISGPGSPNRGLPPGRGMQDMRSMLGTPSLQEMMADHLKQHQQLLMTQQDAMIKTEQEKARKQAMDVLQASGPSAADIGKLAAKTGSALRGLK